MNQRTAFPGVEAALESDDVDALIDVLAKALLLRGVGVEMFSERELERAAAAMCEVLPIPGGGLVFRVVPS